jgi:hypothetical protein
MESTAEKERTEEGVIIAKTHKRANRYLRDPEFWREGMYRSFRELGEELKKPAPPSVRKIIDEEISEPKKSDTGQDKPTVG